MTEIWVQIVVSLVIAAVTAVAAILYASQRERGKAEVIATQHEDNASRIKALEDQERDNVTEHAILKTTVQMLANHIERVDDSKASKEVVDGFRREISELKFDMDKRFDKLERLITQLARGEED